MSFEWCFSVCTFEWKFTLLVFAMKKATQYLMELIGMAI